MNATDKAALVLTDRLYAAAAKAGFERALLVAQVEITACCGRFELCFDREVEELEEGEEAAIDYAAIDRAEKWLERALAEAKRSRRDLAARDRFHRPSLGIAAAHS